MLTKPQLMKLTKDELVDLYYAIPRYKRRSPTERPEFFDKRWIAGKIWEAQWAKDLKVEGVTCAKCYCDDIVELQI
ncbi:MAG: hypothetical protein ACYSR6_10330, partial [Planctomycetota bacterium]